MLDLDFEYSCPHCGGMFLAEHDINKEVQYQTLTCDDCDNKFKVTSRATINIECEVVKI